MMTPAEQEAFVKTYDNTVCDVPRQRVAEFVRCYDAGEVLLNFATYEYTSIVDALGLWHHALQFYQQQEQAI